MSATISNAYLRSLRPRTPVARAVARFGILGLRFRVLDAFRPRGATWSGQVISSQPGASGGPFMTIIPRVHGAQRPVPPRLPLLSTPRSVHHLTTVAAGAYPPCRHPNAWSPGSPAPPGSCYWLVASGTPWSWHGGCLAAGLVRGWLTTTASAGAVPCSCVRYTRGRSGGPGPEPDFVFSPSPPSRPAFAALRVAGRPDRMSLTVPRWYAIPCGLCVPPDWSGCPSGIPRVSFVCVCACALVASAPFLPPRVCVARAPRVVPMRVPVGRFHPFRATPRFLPRTRALSGLLRGGAARSCSPLAWPGVVCLLTGGPPRQGRSGAGEDRVEGGAVCRPPRSRGRGAPRGGGSLYPGPSLCLPWAGTKAGVISVAQFLEGMASILLRFVFAC